MPRKRKHPSLKGHLVLFAEGGAHVLSSILMFGLHFFSKGNICKVPHKYHTPDYAHALFKNELWINLQNLSNIMQVKMALEN